MINATRSRVGKIRELHRERRRSERTVESEFIQGCYRSPSGNPAIEFSLSGDRDRKKNPRTGEVRGKFRVQIKTKCERKWFLSQSLNGLQI